MRFWDASAIVPLLVFETSSRALQALAKQDPTMLVWWGSEVECASALARIERDGALDPRGVTLAFDRLRLLSHVWHEIEPSDLIRQTAVRFLRVHPLRAADALQLAAVFAAAEHRPTSLDVVTLDERLAVAASKEGFPVLGAERLSQS
jgi:predicted nucleic acid-binding protein